MHRQQQDQEGPRLSRGRVQYRSRLLRSVETLSDIHGGWYLCLVTGRGFVSFNWKGSGYDPVTIELSLVDEASRIWIGLHPNGHARVELQVLHMTTWQI